MDLQHPLEYRLPSSTTLENKDASNQFLKEFQADKTNSLHSWKAANSDTTGSQSLVLAGFSNNFELTNARGRGLNEAPNRQGLSIESSRIHAVGGIYSAITPPGAGAHPGGLFPSMNTWREFGRTSIQSFVENGRSVTTFDRNIRGAVGFEWDAYPPSIPTHVREEVDVRSGILERRTVTYPRIQVDFRVRTSDGGVQSLQDVSRVDVVRNSTNGEYTSTYTTQGNRTLVVRSGADGAPRR